MLHSVKPEGGTLWLLTIAPPGSTDSAINHGNFTALLVARLMRVTTTCALVPPRALHTCNVIPHVLCLLFPKFSKRDGKLSGIDLLNEIKCILYLFFK